MKNILITLVVSLLLSSASLLAQEHKGWSVGLEITPSFFEETFTEEGYALFGKERLSLNGGFSMIKSLNKNFFLEGKILSFKQKKLYIQKYTGDQEFEELILRRKHFLKIPISINYRWKNLYAGIGISVKPMIEKIYIVDGVKTDRFFPELVRPLMGNEVKIGYVLNVKEKLLIRTEVFLDYMVNQRTFDYGFSLGIFYNLNTKK